MNSIANIGANTKVDNRKVSIEQALIISFFSFMLMVLLAILIGVCWETNDDPAIAVLLSRNSYYCIFVGKILSAFIHFFYQNFPNFHFNWWLGFSVVSVSIGIGSLIYVVFRKNTKNIALVLSSVIFVAGWYFAISQMNFTRTAMALASGGVALVSYALYVSDRKHKIILWLIGLILMLVGEAIRYECCYLALGFLAASGGVFLLQQKNVFTKEWFIRNRTAIIFLILTACFVFAASMFDGAFLTQNDRQQKAFQAARSNVKDYGSLYPDYAGHSEKYERYGFSENDWKLFGQWIDGDTSFYTLERLERVGELKAESDLLYGAKEVISILVSTPLGWMLIMMSMLILLMNFKRNVLSVIFTAVFTMIFFGYIVWLGRINFRVTDSIYWGALTSLWISSGYLEKRKSKKYLKFLLSFFLIIWTIFMSSYTKGNGQLVPLLRDGGKGGQEAAELFDYIDHHKENIYMPTVINSGISLSELLTWRKLPQNYCNNIIKIGGWTSRLSSETDRWKEYSIENPMQALLFNENAYLYFKTDQTDSADLILNYFREHYSETTQMRTVEQIGSYSIVKYYE